MSRILVISSWVARGHVGLSAIVPALQALGHDVVAFPTVILSNHPGHAVFAGDRVPVAQLEKMLDALDANDWLRDIDAALTGYFPSAEHVAFARSAIARLSRANPRAVICCDPVLGDDPDGLYVPDEVAAAIKAQLLPLSHCITPNRFELEWLSGRSVRSPDDSAAAARLLGRPLTLVTSVPAGPTELANVAIDADSAWVASTRRLDGVPHGTGDMLSALFVAAHLSGKTPPEALAVASAAVSAAVAASLGADELRLAATQPQWTAARPTEIRRL